MRQTALLGVLLLAYATSPARVTAQPTLSFAQPHAALPGQTTEVTLHGDKLEEPLSVWSSFPAQIEILRELDETGQPKPNPDPKTLRLRVTMPADAPVSVGGLVVGTKSGVSEPLVFMLDDLPSVTEMANNHSPEAAQEIPFLTAVDGVCDGTLFDYYRLSAKAGQRIAVEVVAQRLGSALDPVLRLIDPAGKEVAFIDDAPALGADARLAAVCVQDGAYVLEVRDVQYHSGGRYRLRVGDFPLVDTTFPLGGPRGASTEFRFTGFDGLATAPTPLAISDLAPQQTPLAARLPNGQSSTMVLTAVSLLPNTIEPEPDISPEAASVVAAPVAINGQFQAPGDRDAYRFSAKKDQKFVLRGISRTLGSPSYLLMRIRDEKGATLAEAGAANPVEALAWTAPTDGDYQLEVEELFQNGGPGHAYRLEFEFDAPRFSLALKNDKNTPHTFVTHADGAFALDVQIERQGYEGPIRLTLHAPREGFQVRQEQVPPGAKEAKLLVLPPADIQEGELWALRFTGEGEQGVQAELSTAVLLKTKRPELLEVPAWRDGVIHVAVGAPPEAFFGLTPKESLLTFDATAKNATFVLPLERKNKEYKTDPIVWVEGLPSGASATVKKEGKDADERFEVVVTGEGLTAGEHAFSIYAYGDFNGRGTKTKVEVKLKVE